MRRMKGFLVSAAMAAMLLGTGVMAGAEETETTATETAVTEAAAVEETDASGLLASDVAALENYAEQSIQMIVGMTDEQMENVLHPASVLSVTQDSVVESVQSWKDTKDELGEFVSIDAHEVTVGKDTILVKTACTFSESQGLVTTTLNRKDLAMESVLFGTGTKSFAQNMKEAALNTVMGLGVVFMVLIFLSFLISRFAYISKLEEKFKKKAAPTAAPAPAPAAPAAAPAVEEEEVDDGELIAVIAAAIAAAEGTSTDGFVVRSIKKSNRNKWQRAY